MSVCAICLEIVQKSRAERTPEDDLKEFDEDGKDEENQIAPGDETKGLVRCERGHEFHAMCFMNLMMAKEKGTRALCPLCRGVFVCSVCEDGARQKEGGGTAGKIDSRVVCMACIVTGQLDAVLQAKDGRRAGPPGEAESSEDVQIRRAIETEYQKILWAFGGNILRIRDEYAQRRSSLYYHAYGSSRFPSFSQRTLEEIRANERRTVMSVWAQPPRSASIPMQRPRAVPNNGSRDVRLVRVLLQIIQEHVLQYAGVSVLVLCLERGVFIDLSKCQKGIRYVLGCAWLDNTFASKIVPERLVRAISAIAQFYTSTFVDMIVKGAGAILCVATGDLTGATIDALTRVTGNYSALYFAMLKIIAFANVYVSLWMCCDRLVMAILGDMEAFPPLFTMRDPNQINYNEEAERDRAATERAEREEFHRNLMRLKAAHGFVRAWGLFSIWTSTVSYLVEMLVAEG